MIQGEISQQRFSEAFLSKLFTQSGPHRHGAIFIQDDVPFPLGQVFADVVGHGVWFQHKPALVPVLPLVTLLNHVALQRQTKTFVRTRDPSLQGEENWTHLFEDVQDELQVDLVDAHGEHLLVHALAKMSRTHQTDELPGVQTLLLRVEQQFVVLETLLHPAAPHGLRQLTQEVLDLENG